PGEQVVGDAEWAVDGRHEDAALQIDDRIGDAGAGGPFVHSYAWCTSRIVGRAQYAARRTVRLIDGAVEVVGEFALVPDMISGGEHVDAEIEKLLGDLRGEAEATGGILSVGNAEIDAVLPEQRRNLLAHNRPPRPPENISDKQNMQVRSLENFLHLHAITGYWARL